LILNILCDIIHDIHNAFNKPVYICRHFANIVLILTLQVDQGWSAQKRRAEVLEETGSKDLSVSKQTNKLWRFMQAKP